MRRRAAPLAAAVLAAALLAAAARPAAAQLPAAAPSPQPSAGMLAVQPPVNASLNRNGQPLMTPTFVNIAGREVYYEVPQDPVGLLFFFHGCVHNAFDHWYNSPACPECRGAGRGGGALVLVLALAPAAAERCWAEAGAAGGRQPAPAQATQACCLPTPILNLFSQLLPLSAGLPEEVSHTKQALALGYAFVAINSIDRSEGFRCYRWAATALA
jgi:hypothetical protein